MIIKGNQRGFGRELARHLLNDRDNDHVEIGDISGVAAQDPEGAFIEIEAVAKGTQCRQPFFSVSFNPPETESPTLEDFDAAFARVEEAMGLEGQPRVVVFHEKEGRRHAHVVWSRINVDHMRAVPLSFFKRRLTEVSRELYLMHGWQMPPGLEDTRRRDPLNFSREEAALAKRLRADPKRMKEQLQTAASRADTLKALGAVMEEQGFVLARGDRRGLVLIDYRGDAHALSRALNMRTKELRARYGDDLASLPDLEQARERMRGQVSGLLDARISSVEADHRNQRAPLIKELHALRLEQREARHNLLRSQAERYRTEETQRMDRFRTGLRGLWDRIIGRHSRTARLNAAERDECNTRDSAERDAIIREQKSARRTLGERMKALKSRHIFERERLRSFVGRLLGDSGSTKDRSSKADPSMFQDLKRKAQKRLRENRQKKARQGKDRSGDRDFD